MSERACVRGCTVKDVHYATCPDFGKVETTTCKGCVPVVARDGVLICDRDYQRLRRLLSEAPDLVGHLRSIADPMKAAVYDKVLVSSSRPELPAPVAADLIDASNDIMRTLRVWSVFVQSGVIREPRALRAGIDGADAYDEAVGHVTVLLGALDDLANDSHQVGALCDGVIVSHGAVPAYWSVADAAARWRVDDRPRWAENPCPECDLKTVRVTPPRFRGDDARFRCTTCAWERSDADDGGFWAEAFAEVLPVVDYEEVVAMDVREDPKVWIEAEL